MNTQITVVHPFEPVYDENSKILILGSFPSVKSREQGFYYAHPQNRMWKILSIILNTKIGASADDKKCFLLDYNIAMWDVLLKCDITGSADSSIKNIIPADLTPVIDYGKLRAVFCNGGVSYKYYLKFDKNKFGLPVFKMPSTSPANARYRLEHLVSTWSAIKDYLY